MASTMIDDCLASVTWPSVAVPLVGDPNSVAQIFLAPSPLSTIVWRTVGRSFQVRPVHPSDGEHGYEYGWKLIASNEPLAPFAYSAVTHVLPAMLPSLLRVPPTPPLSTLTPASTPLIAA